MRQPELRQRIRDVAWNQAQVTDASLFIVLCADLKAWERQPVRYWKNAATELRDFMVPAIDGYYRGKNQVQRDEAMRSCGIASQTLMLAAKSLGYDSGAMVGFDFDEVAKLIKLPEDHVIAMFEDIFDVAHAQGWKALELSRGGFSVIEFWIENSVMIELLTPDMAKDYLFATRRFIKSRFD